MLSLFSQLDAVASPRAPVTHRISRKGFQSPESIAKQLATKEALLKENWRKVFAEFNNKRAGTSTLARAVGRNPVSVHGSMLGLLERGWIKRDGIIPHPKNGRDQIIWKWVAE